MRHSETLVTTGDYYCFRCGESLRSLTPPISRRDLCPGCSAELRVCRMCQHFLATAPRQCTEDEAEEVVEKERANFCEWFSPRGDAYDAARHRAEQRAANELGALFGEDEHSADPEKGGTGSEPASAAEDLFK